MHHKIKPLTDTIDNLDDLAIALISLLKETRNIGSTQIGYVSGMITSEGPQNIAKNIEILEKHTSTLRNKYLYPIFSATDVFYDQLFARIDARGAKNTDYEHFWNQVLSSRYITDIFMTPRWELSHGACDELATAKRLQLTIHYM